MTAPVRAACFHKDNMSYSLNSLKGGYIGDYIGTTIGGTKGDTRSLDNGSYDPPRLTWKLESVNVHGNMILFV